MTVSRFTAVVALTAVAAFATATQSYAQGGTVSAPTTSNVTKTTFDVTGTYTVDPGWRVKVAYISVVPSAGGPSFSTPLVAHNGNLGLMTSQGIVPKTVTGLNYGTKYDIRLTVKYEQISNPRVTGPVSGVLGNVTTQGP